MAIFIFVAGAWLGGWCWRDVASPLQAAGHTVIAATLSGLGERAHLLSRQIGLRTHVSDVVELLRYRDLRGVTLIGHSYGGTVITAAAEQVPERIGRLVYLDASIPRDGESNNDVIGPRQTAQLRAWAETDGEGWRVPPAPYVLENLSDVARQWVAERLTPHPLRPFEEAVQLRSPAAASLPRSFLQTSLQSGLYRGLMARARAAGWHCRELKGGHYPMFREPQLVAAALSELPA
jgi:pimeloyl-ACP methyl ester carboxylesterase